MRRFLITIAACLVLMNCCVCPARAAEQGAAARKTYDATWQSLDTRPLPKWFDEAKFGIFIHWGVYSVPAWGPKGRYAEWYWHDMKQKYNPTKGFHEKTYGADFKYKQFAPRFNCEMFDAKKWARLFKRAGAKYVVLTSKHHDGYCLWPAPDSPGWNSVDVGPKRDLCGELTRAVTDAGLKMGMYYSLYEWYHPLYLGDVDKYVETHMMPQLKDLVTRYEPSVLFADGEWEKPEGTWHSKEFLAWLYSESPCRETVVANDRWFKGCRSAHGDYFTTEYGRHAPKEQSAAKKWEENRGMGSSYGYNRNEDISDYRSSAELIHLLIEMVCHGGNLLLDVGPTADGRIPVIMQERLVEIGDWLWANGEAIYGTKPWRAAEEGNVRYTTKDGNVYAICLRWPGRELVLGEPKPTEKTTVTMLGLQGALKWKDDEGNLAILVPQLPANKLPCQHAWVFKLTGIAAESGEPAEADPFAWKDLFDGKTFKGWKAPHFGAEGEVYVKDGAAVMETGSSMTGITYTGKVPRDNYEISLEGKRLAGSDFFCTTTFPVGKDPCTLVVGGWGGTVVGLSSVDFYDASDNSTSSFREFKDNQWYRFRIRVTPQKIQCWIDDDQVVDQERKGHKFSIRDEVELCKPLGISTWETTGAVRNIRIRQLKPATKEPNKSGDGP